ncbi:MAG: hypothetical protein ACT4PT_02555, partial [Methanobacteriota archaeon]
AGVGLVVVLVGIAGALLDWGLTLSWVLVVLAVLLFVGIVVVQYGPARTGVAATAESGREDEYGAEGAAEEYTPAMEERPPAVPLKLKCGNCQTVFTVQDTGERPLYHSCPGCGRQGVLRTPPKTAAGGVRTVKVRCRDCNQVFEATDTGARPLGLDCPNCGAHGQMR